MDRDRYDAATLGRVVGIIGKQTAKVDLGGGTLIQVNVALVDVKLGDYVLVHGGYAIQVVNRSEAELTLKKWKEK